MRGILTGVIWAEGPKAWIAEADAFDGLGEGSVRLDAIAGDGGAGVVGDEEGFEGGSDGEIGWTGSGGGDLAEQVECAGGVDGVGRDAGGVLVAFIGDVQDAAFGRLAEDHPGWVDTGGCRGGGGQVAGCEVEARDVDAFAASVGV